MTKNSTAGKYPIGYKINHWTFLESPKHQKHKILCQCDCGNQKTVDVGNILQGLSLRCKPCSSKNHMTTHGASDAGGKHKADRLYRIWKAMKWRCNAKNRTEDYHLYYERGIRVCEQWLHSYETFRDWAIENGYKDNLSIDRFPDKNGNYYPTNCRWADAKTQARNTRSNRLFTAFGETKTMIEWILDARCKPNHDAFRKRIYDGWDFIEALTTPLQRQ